MASMFMATYSNGCRGVSEAGYNGRLRGLQEMFKIARLRS